MYSCKDLQILLPSSEYMVNTKDKRSTKRVISYHEIKRIELRFEIYGRAYRIQLQTRFRDKNTKE